MDVQAESDLESFLRWAAAVGVTDSPISHCLGHSLSVSYFPEAGGRGLAAVRDIVKGELVLRVPKDALMTTDTLRSKDQKLSAALREHRTLSSTEILAIALLNELNKGKVTWWYPYLKQLPRSYDILASFGRLEIEALQVDDAIWTAEKAVEKHKIDWREATLLMAELDFKPQLSTFKAWLWASATISSRTMHIPWDSAGCLCPVGDFFNYAAPAEEEPLDANVQRLTDAGYEEEANAYCFYARRNYRKGDQVLVSYGTYTNLELVEHYGFLLHDNPNDKAFIPLEPNMYALCSWPKESLYLHQDGKPSFALLATIRLWATPTANRRSVGRIAYSGHQISPENEITMLKWIRKQSQALLESFPTSLEQDKFLLETIGKIQDYSRLLTEFGDACIGELRASLGLNDRKVNRKSFQRWKLAVEWRLSYKRILCECVCYCNERLDDIYSQTQFGNEIKRTS